MDVTLQHVEFSYEPGEGITGYFADRTIRRICLSGGSVRLWKKVPLRHFDRGRIAHFRDRSRSIMYRFRRLKSQSDG